MSRSAGFAIEAYQYPLGSTQIPALWSGLVPADLDDAKGVPSQGGEDEKTAGPTAQQLKEIEGDVQRRCEAGRLRGFEEALARPGQASRSSRNYAVLRIGAGGHNPKPENASR